MAGLHARLLLPGTRHGESRGVGDLARPHPPLTTFLLPAFESGASHNHGEEFKRGVREGGERREVK